MAVDRTGVSNRAAAMLASSVLVDVGIITPDSYSPVIDKNKVRRQTKNLRKDLQEEELRDVFLQALYFDGRRDKTLNVSQRGKKFYKETAIEDHYVLIQEPGSKYLGHVEVETSTAKQISTKILEYLDENEISTESIVAIGCDGTPVNTGAKGGVIRLLELKLGRSVQWLSCQLHANELPLRHLLHFIDGATTGPTSFSGEIGKKLESCDQLPVANFQRIKVDLPKLNLKELSTDQQYLYQIGKAISDGKCTDDLCNKSPGKLAHSRWLTAANRILRLYVTEENPSSSLQTLVKFVLKVYVPTYFDIKLYPKCFNGTKHLWKSIQRSRYLPDEIKAIVDPVIQRNGYAGHPENIILAMINDTRKHIRELGLRRILKARQDRERKGIIRRFEIPSFNFGAVDYFEIIDWSKCQVTEPPLTRNFTDDALHEFIKTGVVPFQELWKIPFHTQAVERGIKNVTEASLSVAGGSCRDGFIRSRLKSRKKIATFDHKSHFTL